MLDDFFERLHAAVVHVGAGAGDLAQRRRLERALVAFDLGHLEAAEVGLGVVDADADVVERLVGEIRPGVAGRAVALAEEELHAALGRGGQRRLVAGLEAVVRSVAREHGPLERGDRLGDVFGRHVGAEDLLELLAIAGNLVELGDAVFELVVHLDRVLDRARGPGLRGDGRGRPRTAARL